MSEHIDFYFDFSSPYGYLTSQKIESIAGKHNRSVNWHPIMLGFIFKVTKQAPLTEAPLKGEYAVMDMERSARLDNIAYRHPQPFPVGTIGAARAFYWLNATDNLKASEFVHAVMKGYYVDGVDISDTGNVLDIAASIGVERAALQAALTEQGVKDNLKKAVDSAIEKGVFGSPTVIVDGEMFWGHDRLAQIDQWLETGGW